MHLMLVDDALLSQSNIFDDTTLVREGHWPSVASMTMGHPGEQFLE